ncbi:hypothetical protein BDK51DRAFT_47976 [Blyttiomyces helicus]|uniref:Uncharacterized protein n=1 Tax=Blyttiomyces helicus TaxID=388810 RepID=A0A4P9WNF5_9FUNG|nr:hypothetical protein BDK51DRAFT_47976 [Blyttiomyces helicus]|eukprot:RKO94639.1 hypothetical protein BDK51DRAFT_47976 [Blyttiomyces helicus]
MDLSGLNLRGLRQYFHVDVLRLYHQITMSPYRDPTRVYMPPPVEFEGEELRIAEQAFTVFALFLTHASTPVGNKEWVALHQTATGIKCVDAQPIINRLGNATKNSKTAPPYIQQIFNDIGNHINLLNPLFFLTFFNRHLDTPVESLHTILHGLVKRVMRLIMEPLIKKGKEKIKPALAARTWRISNIDRINSFNIQGLPRALDGTTLYHLRGVLALFAFWEYSEQTGDTCWLEVWEAIGRLTAALVAFARVDLTLVKQSRKAHILLHLTDDIVRLGPSPLHATERMEGFNLVFRTVLLHTNRQAASRDAATWFARLYAIRHLVSGGFCEVEDETGTKCWVQAGEKVREYWKDQVYREALGAAKDGSLEPGKARGSIPNKPSLHSSVVAGDGLKCIEGVLAVAQMTRGGRHLVVRILDIHKANPPSWSVSIAVRECDLGAMFGRVARSSQMHW